MNDPKTRIDDLLSFLYGEQTAARIRPALIARMEAFRAGSPQQATPIPPKTGRLTERDAILVTYGDQFRAPEQAPLRTLRAFLDDHLHDAINGVHILPCFPYSSDDGFSVIDYRQVDPELGDWDDVAALGERYRLMFDFVANHISQHSAWFAAFRRGEAPYTGYFITTDPSADLSQVVRPRALPLLTPVETAHGPRHVWTTFSADQIDLNYANPQVLLEMTDVLLHYVAQGGQVSHKANPDDPTSVYELNVTLYDFLNDPAHPAPAIDVRRFLASQAILLSLAGVPGIYVHSLFGSRNCHECCAETGRARSLNRRKFDRAVLEASLVNSAEHAGQVFDGYRRMLQVRRAEPAFHPSGEQQVLDLGPAVFTVLRTPPDARRGRPVLCLQSVSPHQQAV